MLSALQEDKRSVKFPRQLGLGFSVDLRCAIALLVSVLVLPAVIVTLAEVVVDRGGGLGPNSLGGDLVGLGEGGGGCQEAEESDERLHL